MTSASDLIKDIEDLELFHQDLTDSFKFKDTDYLSSVRKLSVLGPQTQNQVLDVFASYSSKQQLLANRIFLVLLWVYWEFFAANSVSVNITKYKKTLVKPIKPDNWYKFESTTHPLNELRLLRNCIMHRDSEISSEYLSTFPSGPYRPGDKITVNDTQLKDFSKIVIAQYNHFK